MKFNNQFLTKIHAFLIGCAFLLISPFSFSHQHEMIDFDEIVQKIESLQESDLLTAIKLAKFYEPRIAGFSIEEQAIFKKLQAENYFINSEFELVNQLANDGLLLTKTFAHPNIIMAELLILRGISLNNEDYYKYSTQDYLAALEIAKSLDEPEVIIKSLISLGSVYYSNEEYERSLIVLNNALLSAQKFNNDKYLGLVYFELGLLYSYLNLEEKVQSYLEKALYYFTKIDDHHLIFITLPSLAITHANNNHYSRAISMYHEIILKAKETGNYFVIANMYSKLAEAYITKPQKDPLTAYQFIIEAEKYLNLVQEESSGILLVINKSNILFKLERYTEAQDALNNAESLLVKQSPYIRTYAYQEILLLKSKIKYQDGFYNEAFDIQDQYYQKIVDLKSHINMNSFEELRIQYESKQHEIKAKNLENTRIQQAFDLHSVKEGDRERTYYVFMGSFFILALAWLYSIKFKSQRKLLESRKIDHLTDLPNRQSILSQGATEFSKFSDNTYSVLIIKIDNFTNINQIKGYDIGNSILIEISLIITQSIKYAGYCGKYSSNEFIVLLPNKSLHKAEAIANEIHSVIFNKSWAKYGLKVVSVSIGMSNKKVNSGDSFEALVKSAAHLKNNAVTNGSR